MRKYPVLFILLFLFTLNNVRADDLFFDRGVRFNERAFEIGLNVGASFSSNLFSMEGITRDKFKFRIPGITDDIIIFSNISATPFYIKIGDFRFSLNVDYIGNASRIGASADAGFAVFADASLEYKFEINQFNIYVRPSAFYAIAYAKPEVRFTPNLSTLSIDFTGMRLYTALNTNTMKLDTFTFFPGFDFSIGILYPFARAMGIYKVFALFDFDIGLDILHIPLLSYTMNHYINVASGSIGIKGNSLDNLSLDFGDLLNNVTYEEGKLLVDRPFRTNLYINWRIFGNQLITLTPNLGFSINTLYDDPFSWEYGIRTKFNLINFIAFSVGSNYEDRIWKNRLSAALNFRLIEVNAAIEFKTEDFFRVLKTNGAGAYVGFKVGW